MTNLKALEVFTLQTICDAGILLSIVSFLLHVGRPYFERIEAKQPLRVAADAWSSIHVVLRDGSLFCAALFGLMHLNLDIMADIKVGLPFVPFGTVCLAAALLVKVARDAEDPRATWLVLAGAVLNTIGYVFVMEAPGDEYALAHTALFTSLAALRSDHNPELATWIFFASWACLAGMSVPVIASAMRRPGAAKARANEARTNDDVAT